MGLETADKVADLNPLWPLGTDPKSQGDDHLRLLKSVLQKMNASDQELADLVNDKWVTPLGLTKSPISPIGYQSVMAPAGSMLSPAAGVSAGASLISFNGATNGAEWQALEFPAGADSEAQLTVPMPEGLEAGEPISVSLLWAHPTATAFGVSWLLDALSIGGDESIDPAFGAVTQIDDTGALADTLYASPWSDVEAGDMAKGDMLQVRVSRKPATVQDTLDVSAYLVALRIRYKIDKANDATA